MLCCSRRPTIKQLAQLHAEGEHAIADLAGIFGVAWPTPYRALDREAAR
jgi:hypothetical protein